MCTLLKFLMHILQPRIGKGKELKQEKNKEQKTYFKFYIFSRAFANITKLNNAHHFYADYSTFH